MAALVFLLVALNICAGVAVIASRQSNWVARLAAAAGIVLMASFYVYANGDTRCGSIVTPRFESCGFNSRIRSAQLLEGLGMGLIGTSICLHFFFRVRQNSGLTARRRELMFIALSIFAVAVITWTVAHYTGRLFYLNT